MFVLLFLLAFGSAFGADYNYTWSMNIPSTGPATGDGIAVADVVEITNPANLPDTTINSSWSYLDCVVKDQKLSLVFKPTSAANWPTALPSGNQATCEATHGGVSYKLTINLTLEPHFWDSKYVSPSVGYVMKAYPGYGVLSSNILPPNKTYEMGSYKARFNPSTPWHHVECSVVPDVNPNSSRAWLIVRTSTTGASNSGYCPVKEVGVPMPFLVPVAFTRL